MCIRSHIKLIPQGLEQQVEQELKRMLALGIIQFDATSSYNSPLVIVKKADNSIRLCNNFIQLNCDRPISDAKPT